MWYAKCSPPEHEVSCLSPTLAATWWPPSKLYKIAAPSFTPKVAQMMLDGYLRPNEERDTSDQHILTPREREVIQLVAEGKTTKRSLRLLT